jgi:hypothetical protein
MILLTSVHGDTTDRGSDVQPSASTSLTELSVVVVHVAGHTNGSASILTNTTHLSALQSNLDVLSNHDLGTIVSGLLVLVDNDGGSSSTAAEDRTPVW